MPLLPSPLTKKKNCAYDYYAQFYLYLQEI